MKAIECLAALSGCLARWSRESVPEEVDFTKEHVVDAPTKGTHASVMSILVPSGRAHSYVVLVVKNRIDASRQPRVIERGGPRHQRHCT